MKNDGASGIPWEPQPFLDEFGDEALQDYYGCRLGLVDHQLEMGG